MSASMLESVTPPTATPATSNSAPGEMFVVPVGVEHQPVATEETELLVIEPSGTPNAGDAAAAARRVII